MKTLFGPTPYFSRFIRESQEGPFGIKRFGPVRALLGTRFEQEDNYFVVSVPVPGLSKHDLNVYTEGRVLVITTKEHAKQQRHFKHAFMLPDDADIHHIEAKCRNGLLTVKADKTGTPKHTVIKVQGGDNVRNTGRHLRSLWEKIRAKMDVRKVLQGRRLWAS